MSDPVAAVIVAALILLALVAVLASIRHPVRRLRVGFFVERDRNDDDHPSSHP